MPDTEYLRQTMRAETSDLPMHLTIDRIRRRANGLRARRTTLIVGACALLITAVAVPGHALHNTFTPAGGGQAAGPLPAPDPSWCSLQLRDPAVYPSGWKDTGVSIQGADGRQYEVLFRDFWQLKNDAALAVAFLDQVTSTSSLWSVTELGGHTDAGFNATGSNGTSRPYQFLSKQLALGPDRVLDLGIYSGATNRITVASEGHSSNAYTSTYENEGWTTFWVVRTAKPLPKDADTGPLAYTGPERLTITAYDDRGLVLDTVTGGSHIGQYTQNPRDDWPEPESGAVPDGSESGAKPDGFATRVCDAPLSVATRSLLPDSPPAGTKPSSTP